MNYKDKILESIREDYPDAELYFTISVYRDERFIVNVPSMGELREILKNDNDAYTYMDYYDVIDMRKAINGGCFKEQYDKEIVLECQFDNDHSDILCYGRTKEDALKRYYLKYIK